MKLSDLLDSKGIKYIPVTLIRYSYIDKNDKLSLGKKVGLPIGWNKPEFWIEKYKYVRPYTPTPKKSHRNPQILETINDVIFIATGSINRLTCIDVDSHRFIDHLNQHNFNIRKHAQTTSCRKKLPHLYIPFEESHITSKIKLDGEDFGDLQAQKAGGKADGMIEINVELDSFELYTLQDWERELIFNLVASRLPKVSRRIAAGHGVSELFGTQFQTVIEMINYIPLDTISDRNGWVAWAYMFKEVWLDDDGYQFWSYLSQRDIEQFDELECENEWETFIPDRTGIEKLFSCLYDHAPRPEFFRLINNYHYEYVRHYFVPQNMPEFYSWVYDSPRLRMIPDVPERCILLDARMGSGKTTQMVNLIDRLGLKVICVTPRISLANALSKSFKARNYQDLNPSYMDVANRLCIQLESLIKISVPEEDYVLVIDEVVSVLNQLNSHQTMKSKKRAETYSLFQRLIAGASKIILADAFFNRSTMEILHSLIDRDEIYHIKNTNKYPARRKVVTICEGQNSDSISNDFFKIMSSKIVKLLETKKLYIFCSAKNAAIDLHDCLTKRGFSGKAYHSKMDDCQKIDFVDVNDSWSRVRYIIVTTTVMVGLSYDQGDFDAIVFVGSGFGPTVRDSLQSIHRVRNPKSRDVYLFINKHQDYRYFKTKAGLEAKYQYLAKELGLESMTEEWIKNNAINSKLEKIYSGSFYHKMLEDYFRIVGIKKVRYETFDEPLIENEVDPEKPELNLNKKEIEALFTRVYRGCASMADKQLYERYLVSNFFVEGFDASKFSASDIPKLELIKTLKSGASVQKGNVYINSDDETKLCAFKKIFASLEIDPSTMFDEKTFISVGAIERLNPELLSLFGTGKEPVKALQSMFNYIKLPLEKKQERNNYKRTITGYYITDKGKNKGLWKNIK